MLVPERRVCDRCEKDRELLKLINGNDIIFRKDQSMDNDVTIFDHDAEFCEDCITVIRRVILDFAVKGIND